MLGFIPIWYILAANFILGLLYLMFVEFEDESVRSHWKKPIWVFKKLDLKFLNNNLASRNKWKQDKNGNLIPYKKKWYHFGIAPKYEEAFPFSSTILVPFTDGEHYFQFLKNRCIEAAISITWWPAVVAWFLGKSLMQLIKEKFMKGVD